MKIDLNSNGVRGDWNNMFQTLITLVSPAYDGDEGHGWKHLNEVLKRCTKIHKHFNNGVIPATAYRVYIVSTLLHDVYSSTDRNQHHVLAASLASNLHQIKNSKQSNVYTQRVEKLTMSKIPKQDGSNWKEDSFKFLDYLTLDEIQIVIDCVVNHRSSNTNKPITLLGKVFAAADNDPVDIRKILGRIDSCSQEDKDYVVPELLEEDKKLLSYDKYTIRTYLHLREKFSRDGYMFKNMKPDSMFMTYYKDDINKFWEEVDEVMKEPGLILQYIREYKYDQQ